MNASRTAANVSSCRSKNDKQALPLTTTVSIVAAVLFSVGIQEWQGTSLLLPIEPENLFDVLEILSFNVAICFVAVQYVEVNSLISSRK